MKQWESALVGPETPLEEAIITLDREALRIVLIVDSERKLLGTLTDGDVRRALLARRPLTGPVSETMCNTPRSAKKGWSRERILKDMEKYQVLQLPITDDAGRVVGLETLYGLLNNQRRDNPVFLMAGGFGTRLHPLTHTCPKPLLKVGGKPILELILERFVQAGFHRFYISTHYMPEMIREHFGDGEQWGIKICYIHEEHPLGTGGALGLLPHDEIDLPLFVMNGDLLTTLNFQSLLEFHETHQGVATMCVREYEHCIPYGVIQSEGHRIRSMIEKPVHRFFINAGIYLLSPEFVKAVMPNARVDMPTLLEQKIEDGCDVNMFPVHEYWLDIGRMEDYQRAQQEVEKLNVTKN
ncbi:nucleotidyltransferase family protein [Pseudomonas sp. PS1]|uniref:Nucleotidyltransferase family protein n=1 Tax=Stutzerimonas marianensis TaxID=2929513 RepID=A0A9X2ARF5_9GAMM|nr:nucleotidyltransferase family protein [Pseudomonas marianensis]MCJ0972455.1 nucleotidyltransferase family protein [Pseudomonas marianensis]